MSDPKRSWISGKKTGSVNDWELPVDDSKPRSAGMSSKMTGSLAVLDAECYRLWVKVPVDMMNKLVQATSWVQDAARVSDMDDNERDMFACWDAYRALEVRYGASRTDLERVSKRIEELERFVAETRQSASAGRLRRSLFVIKRPRAPCMR